MAMVMLIVVGVTRWIDTSDNDVVTQLDRIPAIPPNMTQLKLRPYRITILVMLGGIVAMQVGIFCERNIYRLLLSID